MTQKEIEKQAEEYCAQKVKELSEQKEWYVIDLGKVVKGNRYCTTTTPCNFRVVDHGSKEYCEQKARELNEQEESAEHPLTYYELSQLLKCFGVDLYNSKEMFLNNTIIGYVVTDENEVLSDGYKIRYKCGEWMPATRETIMKWWQEDCSNDIPRFISFMGWFEKKFYSEKYSTSIPLECISPTPDEIGG